MQVVRRDDQFGVVLLDTDTAAPPPAPVLERTTVAAPRPRAAKRLARVPKPSKYDANSNVFEDLALRQPLATDRELPRPRAVPPVSAAAERDSQLQWFRDAAQIAHRVNAGILQTSPAKASRLMNAVLMKTAGAAAITGVMGLVATIGTASTGTAIATLSGAAANTATLFWLGSLVGGGVFAGTLVTGGLGLLAGVAAKHWLLGWRRKPDELSKAEQRLVVAGAALAKAFGGQVDFGTSVPNDAFSVALKQGWAPWVEEAKRYAESVEAGALTTVARIRLRRAVTHAGQHMIRGEEICTSAAL